MSAIERIVELLTRARRERRIHEWMLSHPGYHLIAHLLADKVTATSDVSILIESCNRLVMRGYLCKRRHRVHWCEYAAAGKRMSAEDGPLNALLCN